MVDQVGTAMAKLHQIPCPDYLPAQHAYGLQTFPNVLTRGIDTAYEDWLAKRYAALQNELPTNLPCGLIHGDVFFDNVLFEGKTFKALIDFEEACHYYKVFDLGMAIVGLCTQNSKVNLTKVRALIKGYQNVRVLEQDEKETLQFMVEYAAAATSSWRYWKYNIKTPNIENSDKHYEMVRVAKDVRGTPRNEFENSIFI